MVRLSCFLFLLLFSSCTSKLTIADIRKTDDFRWMEERESERVKKWVTAEKDRVEKKYAVGRGFQETLKSVNSIVKRKSALPEIMYIGDYAYTVYRGYPKSRGVWKRILYKKAHYPISRWKTVLDLDKLNHEKGKTYTFSDAVCLKPDNQRCLISLATEGGDTVEVFEFDVNSRKFIEGGFYWPPGKTNVGWLGRDTILISGKFEENDTLKSGFGRHLKAWSRKTKTVSRNNLLTAPEDFLGIFLYQFESIKFGNLVIARIYHSKLKSEIWIFKGRHKVRVPLPNGSMVSGAVNGQLIASLNGSWLVGPKKYKEGDIVALSIDTLLFGNSKTVTDLVFRPSKQQFPSSSIVVSKDTVAVELLEDVRSKVVFIKSTVHGFEPLKTFFKKDANRRLIDVVYRRDSFLIGVEDFLVPPSLIRAEPATSKVSTIAIGPEEFSTKSMLVQQYWAASSDGVKVPYFVIGRAEGGVFRRSPLILRGYGAYGISYLPRYDAILGKHWLERGGLMVVANVRGGGEFGSQWYKASVGKTRYRSSLDFIAVSEDLIRRDITDKDHLGIYGGSAGGLLLGMSMVKRPDLYKAVCALVPAIDIVGGEKLLSGANWKGEFGDPSNPDDLKSIITHSPYFNLKKAVSYPTYLGYAITSDERVHPGHSRKFAAKLRSLGHANSFHFELGEGGHRASSTNSQQAFWKSIVVSFFSKELGLKREK